jgi:hypothetical protein
MNTNWKIIREQDDIMAFRLSIGCPLGFDMTENGYIVYRGGTEHCIKLLEEALKNLKMHYEEHGE